MRKVRIDQLTPPGITVTRSRKRRGGSAPREPTPLRLAQAAPERTVANGERSVMAEDFVKSQRDESLPVARRRMSAVCVSMFILLVLTLPRLGRAPLWRTLEPEGVLVLDLMSFLGLVGGLFAAVYLSVRFRRILTLSPTVKVMGLVGAGGLIVHLGFSLLNLVIVLLAT